MKILSLHSGDRSPSARFRVLPYVPYFRRKGHRVTVLGSFPQKYDYFPWMGFRPSQLLKRLVRRLHLLRCRFGRYDIAFVERELFDNPAWDFEARLRTLAPVFVLDVDDAIFLRYPEKFGRLVEMSDLVIAGNRLIKDKVLPKKSHTVVIPTCVELAKYPEKPVAIDGKHCPIIGWVGTPGNIPYLKVASSALRALAKRCDFELRIITSDHRPLADIDLQGVNVNTLSWRGEFEVEDLHTFDIGLMPLFLDEEWGKYKCGFKLIQYMAIGIPGVASPVGVDRDIIEHGVDGFLADSANDWESILQTLVQNPELRRSIGTKARAKVMERYSIEAHFPRLEQSLMEALHRIKETR